LVDHPIFAEHPGVLADELPVARQLATEVISLPVHQGLSLVDLGRIATAVRASFEGE
jgi:dTDP-4-amino-4,6-dideoxygalactose transaminase